MPEFNQPIQRVIKPESAPAAGAEFSLRPNKGGGWLIRSIRFVLTTSVVVGNRHVTLRASNGTDTYFEAAAIGNQAESLAVAYSGFSGLNSVASPAVFTPVDWPTDGLWLPQGHILTTDTDNLDVGDQFSAVAGFAVEYPTGPDRVTWAFGPGVSLPTERE